MEDKIKVLFLGTGDTARCQMAEGFLRSLAGDRFIAVSASTEQVQPPTPGEIRTPIQITPLAIEVMKEIGIDISQQRTKYVADVFKDHFAYVVGVCDMEKERCPVFPFTYELLQWDVEDPAAAQAGDREPTVSFRRVRGSIREKTLEFIAGVSEKVAPKAAAAAAGKAR